MAQKINTYVLTLINTHVLIASSNQQRGKKMSLAYKYEIYDDEALFHQDDEYMSRTINEITVSDLMGEDHNVWIKKNSKFGFDIEIQNNEEPGFPLSVFIEKGIHPYAIEGFAEFCRRFLHTYSHAMENIHD